MGAVVKAWSLSRYSTWKECPARLKYQVTKVQFTPKHADNRAPLERGDYIHKLAQRFLKGELNFADLPTKIPSFDPKKPHEETFMGFQLFKKDFTALKKKKAFAELEVAFTKEWDACLPTDWDRAWLRVKIDAAVLENGVVNNIDYKTGRLKEFGHDNQLELYGIAGLIKWPQAKASKGNLWFLDAGEIIGADATSNKRKGTDFVYKRAALPKLIKKWEGLVKPMLNATSFVPTPGNYCRYCAYRKENNGPCKF